MKNSEHYDVSEISYSFFFFFTTDEGVLDFSQISKHTQKNRQKGTAINKWLQVTLLQSEYLAPFLSTAVLIKKSLA